MAIDNLRLHNFCTIVAESLYSLLMENIEVKFTNYSISTGVGTA